MTSDAVDESTRAVSGSARRRFAIGRLLVLGVPPAFLGVLGYQRRWTIDDAFIFFRVVSQLQHGHGPVFNGGERVEITTSPLWLAILTLGRLVTPATISIESIAIALSLLLSVFAVVAIGIAGLRLAALASDGTRAVLLPFGTLIVVATPAFWDYATSGLETALTFAWLAGCFWATVEITRAKHATRSSILTGILVGLGPLVRPDLAIYSVCFLLVLLYVDRDSRARHRIGIIAAAIALPVAYEVFRAGYYATLVPNTALAKEASAARWDRGIAYAKDLAAAYYLVIPLLVVAVAIGVLFARLDQAPKSRDRRVAMLAPVVAAALHALYVVRLGGDYMHARMLLPALFAVVMPVAVVEIRDLAGALATAVVVMWAVVCAASLRPQAVDHYVSDQRAFAVQITHRANPVSLDDYRNSYYFFFYPTGEAPRTLVIPLQLTFRVDRNGVPIINAPRINQSRRELALAPDIHARNGFAFAAIGALGYALGPDVFVIDTGGLGDPIASRLSGFQPRMPTGLLHYMTLPWVEARFAAPSASDPLATVQVERGQARRALACGAPRRLLRDVTGRLSVSRFFGNLVDSVPNTFLRIPVATATAEHEFCGSG